MAQPVVFRRSTAGSPDIFADPAAASSSASASSPQPPPARRRKRPREHASSSPCFEARTTTAAAGAAAATGATPSMPPLPFRPRRAKRRRQTYVPTVVSPPSSSSMSPFPTLSVSQVSRAESVRPPQHTQPLQLSSSQPTQPPRTPVLVYDEESAFCDDDDDDAATAFGSDNSGSDSDDTAAVGVIPFLTPPDCVVPRHPSPPRDEEEAADAAEAAAAAVSAAAAPAPSKVGLTRSSLSASTMSMVLSPDSCRGGSGGLAGAQQHQQQKHAGMETDMADADADADADLCVEQPLLDVHTTPLLPGAGWWRTTTTAAAVASATAPPPLPPVEIAPESRDFAAAEDEEDEEISATPPCLVAAQGNRSQTTDDSESTPVVLSQLPVPPPPSELPSERPLPTPPVLAVAGGAAASAPPSSCRTPGCTTPDVKKVLSYTANWTYGSAAGAATAAATDAPPSAARRPFATPFPPLNYDALVAEERTFVEETPPPQSLRITRPLLDRYRAGFSLKRETALQAYGAENTYILARDAGAEGAKMFCALPRHLVKDLVLSDEPATRCYYAVVPPDVPVDAYIDVDLKLAQLPELCGGAVPACAADAGAFRYRLLEAVLRRLVSALARAEVGPQTIVALEATTEKKVSFHVHCTLQGSHAFANTAELQCFLKAAYSRGGAAAAAAAADGAGESEDALLDRLACEAVDFAPYSRFCCFRLPFCAKMGRSNHLAVLRPEEVVTCPDLAALLAAHAPDRYAATVTDVLDLCLISKPACKQVKHVVGFARLSGGSSVSSASTGTAAARPPRRAGLSASAHAPSGCLELPAGSETEVMIDLLTVFRQLSPHYEGLCAGDLRVKRLSTTYKVSQGRTKWCNQVGRLHNSSTTHYTLSATHISVQCWSPKCVRQVVRATAEIPHLRTPGVLERLFPGAHKKH